MPIYPPGDPFFINIELFGFPIVIRWYGIIIVMAAVVAGWFAARRAQQRGYNPDHVWNLLMLGMILGIAGARTYYVVFEWPRFAGQPFIDIINPRTGGLAIHGGIIGALLAAFLYTAWNKLPFFMWLDICAPTFLLGQALGRWGNFFNQEAYGRPTDLPFGVIIDGDNRLPPFDNLEQYPPSTLFHATFLYESLWNLMGVGVLIWLERGLRGKLRVGDIALGYAIWYGTGRLWVEGLRTDSLCTSGFGGSCEEALRVAQIASLLLIAGGLIGLYLNHTLRPATDPHVVEVQPDETSDDTLNVNHQQEEKTS
ncbi:MAG: prolipoprotein diacylglyceryl transferase [Chloroflexota bacterium]